jgi:cyanophycin synthetase
VRRRDYGPTTQSLVDEARRRGIPVMRLSEGSLVQLGHGRYQQRIRASISGKTSQLAVDAPETRTSPSSCSRTAAFPVPRGVVVRDVEDAVREARRLRYPLVTKPLDGNHGRGVTIGIADEEQLRFGYAEALAQVEGRNHIVEEFFAGHDHRILVGGGKRSRCGAVPGPCGRRRRQRSPS